MLAPWHSPSIPRFKAMARVLLRLRQHMVRIYGASNPCHRKLIDEAMACDASLGLPAVTESCLEGFHWDLPHGFQWDLPHVASVAEESDRVENGRGDMFDCIPNSAKHETERSIPFSAFWLRSSVVSVLISLISDMWANGPHDIKLIF
ncbi:hypothetical protein ACLB2K_011207 [Fragaria x ananassa]